MIIFTVILNYKTYKDLRKCILSLSSSSLPKSYSQKIIVVDSEYESSEHNKFNKMFENVLFIPKKDNLGVGKGYNVGFKKVLSQGPRYVLMVTPDITVEKNTISKLIEIMNSDKKLGIVVPKMLLSRTNRKFYFIKGEIDKRTKSGGHIDYLKIDKGQYDKKYFIESDFVNCSIALIRPELFKKVGYWDEKYFLYYEDLDWCVRAKNAGYKVGAIPSATAYHDESSSVKKGSKIQEYYTTRNLLYFVRKNFSLLELSVSYIYFLKEILLLIKGSINSASKRKKLSIKLVALSHLLTNKMGRQNI